MGPNAKAEGSSWLRVVAIFQLLTFSVAWSTDGHSIICSLARPFMTTATMAAVNNLLNSESPQNFSTLCTWGEETQYLPQYSWSPPLHYINTPDQLCDYNYTRDCVGMFGEPGSCASGAIKNFTSQLLDPASPYNRTESLLFLANIMGDIHQPLRVGFSGDGGGAFIHVWWLDNSNASHTDLFSVWDSGIIHEAYERYYNQSNPTFNETLVDILANMSFSIYSNLTAAEVSEWSPCPAGPPSCPDIYAEESIGLACQFAYANVTPGDILPEQYFSSRLPIVELRLVQAGVRLAATLNRIFDPSYLSPPSVSPPAPQAPQAPQPVTPAPAAAPAPPIPIPVVPPPPALAPPTIPAPVAPAPPLPAPSPTNPSPVVPSPPLPAPTNPAPVVPPSPPTLGPVPGPIPSPPPPLPFSPPAPPVVSPPAPETPLAPAPSLGIPPLPLPPMQG